MGQPKSPRTKGTKCGVVETRETAQGANPSIIVLEGMHGPGRIGPGSGNKVRAIQEKNVVGEKR
jgi:hypothetical protein